MLKKYFGLAILALAGMVFLFVGNVHGESGLRVYVDDDRDGVYILVADYDVSHEEVLRAFAEAGGAPALGYEGELLLNYQYVPGVTLSGPQSWDGFVTFLKRTYGPWAEKDAKLQERCDHMIQIHDNTLAWTCDGLACLPQDLCSGHFASASVDYSCINDPPCPQVPKPKECVKQRARARVADFQVQGGSACWCNVQNNCVTGPGVYVPGTLILAPGQVFCRCQAPTLSQWGVIILVALLIGGAVFIGFRRRKSAVPA